MCVGLFITDERNHDNSATIMKARAGDSGDGSYHKDKFISCSTTRENSCK